MKNNNKTERVILLLVVLLAVSFSSIAASNIFTTGKASIATTQDNETLTVNGSFKETMITPVIVGSVTNSSALDQVQTVRVQGEYAYVNTYYSCQFSILDIHNPTDPQVVSTITNCTYLNGSFDMAVQGDYAYLVHYRGTDSVTVIDVSNKTDPEIVHTFVGTISNDPIGIFLSGGYLYVTEVSGDDFNILDITDPLDIKQVSELRDSTNLNGARDIYVKGDVAYVLEHADDGLTTINISDPANPTILGSIENAVMDNPRGIYVRGRYAYIGGTVSDAFTIIDVADPTTPVIVGNISDQTTILNGANDVVVSGNYAYVTCQESSNLVVIDVSDPTAPFIEAYVTGLSGAREGFAIQGRYAYVSELSTDTLSVVDLHGANLHAANLGAVAATSVDVTSNADIDGNLIVDTGIAVGPQGIHTDGDLIVARHSEDNNFTMKTTGVAKSMYLTTSNSGWGDCDDDPSGCCDAGYHMCTSLEFLEGGRRIEFTGTGRETAIYDTNGNVDPAADADSVDCGDWTNSSGTGRYVCKVSTSINCSITTFSPCNIVSLRTWCCSD